MNADERQARVEVRAHEWSILRRGSAEQVEHVIARLVAGAKNEALWEVASAPVERACEVMHDAYEAAAVGAGWETQQASRKPWADVPEANKATMRAAVSALIEHLTSRPAPDAGDTGAVDGGAGRG
jgi:hypothetical protein